jgi:hypothetical protein
MHVTDGPHAGQKATVWYSLLPQAAFRLEALLNATLAEGSFDREETGEVQVRTVNGAEVEEPIYTFGFDTDDMLGAEVTFEVSVGEYNGKPKNEFNSPRPVVAKAAPAPKVAALPARAAAPATRAAAPAARPVAVAQPARRTVGR